MTSELIKRSKFSDDYELLQQVGSGTYGKVFKARDLRNQKIVAIKIIELKADDNFYFIQQEINLLRECVHPNIISYYGSYIRRNRVYVVTDYCSGGSLQDVYQMTGALSELQVAFVCRETLKGLFYLHDRQKMHRDIKGANILLSSTGDIKLADFGIAAQITATLDKRKTFLGSPYWMAPEVANVTNKDGYGVACDIWAVGITAIELAETRPPLYDLLPMQALNAMTKSGYKPPKLKDKKQWSPMFRDFVKQCLTKNPNKRPSAERLLQSHSFVCGALSSRFTKELLDRVNRPDSARADAPHERSLKNDIEAEMGNKVSREYVQSSDTESASSAGEPTPERMRRYHNRNTLPARNGDDLACGEHAATAPDASDEESAQSLDDGTLRSTAALPPPAFAQRVRASPASTQRSAAAGDVDADDEALVRAMAGVAAANTLSGRFERSASLQPTSPADEGGGEATAAAFRPARLNGHAAFSVRPTSCGGIVPTPKVVMGACFSNIFHNCRLRIHASATWVHPSSGKHYLILGAEEGLFALNMTFEDDGLKQINDRRCSNLYIINDVMIALQGKTPYLYRHDVLQLIHQQLIVLKCSKQMTRVPERFKPRLLHATIRLPETKDAYKFNVERSVLTGALWMCVAVPQHVLLFQWFAPRAMFMHVKTARVEGLSRVNLTPFNFVFGLGALSDNYPEVCIGVYDRSVLDARNDTTAAEGEVTTGHATSTPRRVNGAPTADATDVRLCLEYRLVSFHDNGRLADWVAKSVHVELYETLQPLGAGTQRLAYGDRAKREVVAFKQLDRDTFFIALERSIVITDVDGSIKRTNLLHTSFDFDFKLTAATPLADSVLAFSDHGLQGRSFFNGALTQDIADTSKVYEVIGLENMITLKCRHLEPRVAAAAASAPLTHSTSANLRHMLRPAVVFTKGAQPEKLNDPLDIAILTGHVSTLNSP